MHHNYKDSPVEAIDSSLNMLKQLEAKLKNQKNQFIQPTSPTNQFLFTHGRYKTEPNELTYRNNLQTIPFTLQEKQQQIRSPNNINKSHTFYHSQPTMVQQNQNQHKSVKSVLKQNRKLKKYVNCLLQMNDYLKNQLVKKDTMMGVNKMGHSFELELMRMEVQYLKQLNRDKQLQIRKNIHLKQISKKKSNKRQKQYHRIGSNSQASSRRQHYRSFSAYENSEKKRYQTYPNIHESQLEVQHNGETSEQVSSQRVIKSIQTKKNAKQMTPKAKKQYNVSKKSSNKNVSTQVKNGKKKNTIKEQASWKKCRLCYM